jgi:formylglycine-generating enzyme required for sulfatase activity
MDGESGAHTFSSARRFWVMLAILSETLQACSLSNAPVESGVPPACAEIGQSWTSPVDGMELVCVPAGDFLMGATENDSAAAQDEKPQRQVYLDAFWIDRTEIPNAMFAQCEAAGACHERTYSPYLWGVRLPNGTPYYGETDYQDYPVIMLDSDEAQVYCQWAGRRLPYEAEWEKAARGTDGRLYPWGTELDCQHASYLECKKGPASVTSYVVGDSPYGASNMTGNMWEWTADWYQADYYTQSPIRNPHGPTAGEYRVLRGGGWNSITRELRVANRSTGKPEHSTDGAIGIRCAVSSAIP